MLSDHNVIRWYENLRASSVHTAEVALRRLSRFEDVAKVDHSLLVTMPQKELEDLVQDFARRFEREGYAPDYIGGIIKGLRSWLLHNERELKRKIKIQNSGVPVTLENEKVPEPWQLSEILGAATVRGKVSISFMCFAGVRPGVLGNVDGTDGLVLGDLPELNLETLRFATLPAQVVVRREVSKARHQYQSFLIEKGANYLLTYLEQRREGGEALSPTSPVVKAYEEFKVNALKGLGRQGNATFFLCTQNIEDEIRRAIRQSGYRLRPYVLRSYFESHLLSAQFKKILDPEARAFFGGHKGTIVRTYTLNKHKLPKELFLSLKQQYLEASSFLTGEEITREAIEEKMALAREEGRKLAESKFAEIVKEVREIREMRAQDAEEKKALRADIEALKKSS
jgi:hypothetical protein